MGARARDEVAAGGAQVLVPRLLLSALVAFAVVVAPACGRDEESERAPEPASIAEAATNTTDAGSYRTEFALTMKGLAREPVEMTGGGIFDSKQQVGRMTIDMSGLGKSMGGANFGEAEMIFGGDVFYMKFPFLQKVQPGVKPWIKFDLKEIAAEQGFDFAGFDQLKQSDPAQALAYLRAASGGVKEVGEEKVRGADTTHYRMTVDLRKVAKQFPEQKESIERVITESGVRTVPTEAWIDGDDLVRRMKLTYEDTQVAPGREGDMTMTMDLYDFGVDVQIEPPPRDQVVDIQTLMSRAQR